MSAPNEHWARWIHSSIAKYLKTEVITPNPEISFLVEGLDDRTETFTESPHRAECRVNGPWTQEQSKGYWRLWVDINVLLMFQMGGQTTDVYRLDKIAGKFLAAMDVHIPIFRTGLIAEDPQNDGSLLGCLSPRDGKNDSVRIIHFGQPHKTDRLRQAQVDGRYYMYLCE